MYVGWAMPIGDTQATIKTVVYHIFYLQNYLHIPQVRLPLYWSLAVEEQFLFSLRSFCIFSGDTAGPTLPLL